MITIVYIPCGSREEAEKISETLVKERLAACANIFESSSVYEWKGKIEKTGEFVIFAKTTDKKFAKVRSMVEGMHSYKLPAIIKIKAEANEAYLRWVEDQTKK